MEQTLLQPPGNTEQLADALMALSGSEQLSQVLGDQPPGRIEVSALRWLKDEVARLIHVDIHRAVKLAEVARGGAIV